MTEMLSGFPFYPLTFDKAGRLADVHRQAALISGVATGGATDLFVVAHGWKNDAGAALTLYSELFGNIATLLPPRVAGRKVAVAGVFWPSKPRYRDFGQLTRLGAQGAASLSGEISAAQIEAKLDEFLELFADEPGGEARATVDAARALVAKLPDSPSAQDRFAELLRSLVSETDAAQEEDASDQLLTQPGRELFAKLKDPTLQAPPPNLVGGGVAGLEHSGDAAGFGPVGIAAGAMKLVDQLSYYEMKARAGQVGAEGLNLVLKAVREAAPGLRIHLVGHSFGGRLVTACADGPNAVHPSSLTLLQAAFSHNAFSPAYKPGQPGFFHEVVRQARVRGPIAITHTANDDAVGVAYPIASRLLNQQASAVGDQNDIFGGIGRNGAVKMGEHVKAHRMGGETTAYDLATDKVNNLLADDVIQDRNGEDAHGDVRNLAVANLVLQAAGFAPA